MSQQNPRLATDTIYIATELFPAGEVNLGSRDRYDSTHSEPRHQLVTENFTARSNTTGDLPAPTDQEAGWAGNVSDDKNLFLFPESIPDCPAFR